MGGLTEWLEGIGLSQYGALFAAHAIDKDVLPDIADQDLERLGIPLGHRKKLLRGIAALTVGKVAELGVSCVSPLLAASTLAASVSERRHISVLFCDLVGSTELAARLDPEDLREIIRAYQGACAGAIVRFEGHVTRFVGDGVLACFGYRLAHEDDAERCVLAGCMIVDSVRKLRLPHNIRLQVRVGIESGLVIVGDLIGPMATDEQAVIGETPNVASRLQALAESNDVIIGPGTRRLLGRQFDLIELGPQRLKGIAKPLPAWRVVGESTAESRFVAASSSSPTAGLIGREQELALLLDRWEQAASGEGQIVLLSGEAGVGKSRLAEGLCQRIAHRQRTVVRYQCSPYHQSSPLHPVIRQLECAAHFAPDDALDIKLDRLVQLLGSGNSNVSIFVSLLSIPPGPRCPETDMDPQLAKEKTFSALLDQLAGIASVQPVLILLEDAHWIDPTTQEFFGRIIDLVRELPVLILVTFRTDFVVPWRGHRHMTALLLNRLGRRYSEIMVRQVAAGKALPQGVVKDIIARADGVPLFIEELTKTVLESGLSDKSVELAGEIRAPASVGIPETLQGSLMARLDSLGPAKEVAQIGAVVGREFSYDVISAAKLCGAADLDKALRRLIESELIHVQGDAPRLTYAFKHALVQEVAYAALVRDRRQLIHSAIARAMEERFPETANADPQLIAHHHTEAGQWASAVDWWHRAGLQALGRSSNSEALSHLGKAIELLGNLTESSDRDSLELDLRLRLGSALKGTKGYAVPEFESNYERASALCERIGDQVRLFPSLDGRWLSSFCRGDMPTAAARAQHLLDAANIQENSGPRMNGHLVLGITQSFRGNGLAARASLEKAFALYDPQKHASDTQLYGRNPKVCSLCYQSFALQQLGYPVQAAKALGQAKTLAAETGHFATTALALLFGCIAAVLRRDPAALKEPANELLALSRQHGSQYWELHGQTFVAQFQATEGHLEEALDRIRRCFSGWQARDSAFMRPWLKLMEAELLGNLGRQLDALRHLDEAQELIERTEIRFCEPELHRLRAGTLSARGASDAEVEACFEEAIRIARGQSAKFWELRAASNWARFCRERQRHAQARQLLSEVYNSFTEGFDTPDLQEARALLDSLGVVTAPNTAAAQTRPTRKCADW